MGILKPDYGKGRSNRIQNLLLNGKDAWLSKKYEDYRRVENNTLKDYLYSLPA